MKNSHSQQSEINGYHAMDNNGNVLKKEWTKPDVAEISRFAILGGGDPVKTEATSTPVASL